jgi:hypothetical protein
LVSGAVQPNRTGLQNVFMQNEISALRNYPQVTMC